MSSAANLLIRPLCCGHGCSVLFPTQIGFLEVEEQNGVTGAALQNAVGFLPVSSALAEARGGPQA